MDRIRSHRINVSPIIPLCDAKIEYAIDTIVFGTFVFVGETYSLNICWLELSACHVSSGTGLGSVMGSGLDSSGLA